MQTIAKAEVSLDVHLITHLQKLDSVSFQSIQNQTTKKDQIGAKANVNVLM